MELLLIAPPAKGVLFSTWARAMSAQGHTAIMEGRPEAEGEPLGEYDLGSICGYSDWRRPAEKDRHREEALRALKGAEEVLGRERPDWTFFWKCADHQERAVCAAARALGRRTVHMGIGWVRKPAEPDEMTTYFDLTGGQWSDRNDLVRHQYAALPIGDSDKFDDYLVWWTRTKASKYGQPDEPIPPLPEGREVVFVPLQLDQDAASYHSDGPQTAEELMQWARAIHPEAILLVKPHPCGGWNREAETDEVWVPQANIHDCIDVADRVLTINSNVGFEARLRGKRVCAVGIQHYTQPQGFDWDGFAHFVISDYCLLPREADVLNRRLEVAMEGGGGRQQTRPCQ